jgi:hypothetical protein
MAKSSLAALAIALAMGSAALAQTSGQAPAGPKGCTPQERANKALTQDAGHANGVICPPDIDPAMKAPTPKTGDKAVIPPPGSPGGNPTVQPK